MILEALVSVIVPVYNVEKYLDRCVTSLVNQTLKDIEIILVDDGSTDLSPYMCNEWHNKDERIKVIHQKNKGAAAARNTGIDNAIGKYIVFVDSDDYIELEMYEKMMDINDQYDCDVVMCDCYKENESSRTVFTHDIRSGYYNKDMLYKEYFPVLLMTNSVDFPPTISNWVCLFKKELINQYQLRYKEGMRFSEDLLFGSQVMYYAESFYYMKEKCYYHYMFNPTSVTKTYYEDKWTLMKQLYFAIKEFFLDKDDYDFQRQVDLSLLYFVYHCVGNVKSSHKSKKDKIKIIMNILNDLDVESMFSRIKINSLDISWKLKIITIIFKHKLLL